MAPRGLVGTVIVTAEAAFCLFGLAIVTGLVFAKFARPTARVLFSRVAVVAPRDGVPSLMFRIANERGTNIVEATIHVTLVRWERALEGETVQRFHDLALVAERSITLALTWTAVHPIGPDGPLRRDAREIVWGTRFVDVLAPAPDGGVIYDATRFHDVVRIADAS
jgi:inward rectifier potassium channel